MLQIKKVLKSFQFCDYGEALGLVEFDVYIVKWIFLDEFREVCTGRIIRFADFMSRAWDRG